MVYVLIVITLLFLAAKGYSGKRTSYYIRNTADSFLFNLLRMFFCILIGLALIFIDGAQGSLSVEWQMLLICAFSGVSNALFLSSWILAVRKNSMVSVDVSLTVGSILPAVLCAILFAEPISIPKMLGFALIVAATFILASNSKRSENGGGILGIILLALPALGEGLSSFSQQLYKQFYTEAGGHTHGVYYPKSVFHFYTYVFAAVALLLFFAGFYLLESRDKKSDIAPQTEGDIKQRGAFSIPLRVVLHIFFMAICLFIANYLQTVVTNDFGMPSQMLYPIIKGGSLILVSFTAMIFFGEKITKRSMLGSFVALCGIVCMSVL